MGKALPFPHRRRRHPHRPSLRSKTLDRQRKRLRRRFPSRPCCQQPRQQSRAPLRINQRRLLLPLQRLAWRKMMQRVDGPMSTARPLRRRHRGRSRSLSSGAPVRPLFPLPKKTKSSLSMTTQRRKKIPLQHSPQSLPGGLLPPRDASLADPAVPSSVATKRWRPRRFTPPRPAVNRFSYRVARAPRSPPFPKKTIITTPRSSSSSSSTPRLTVARCRRERLVTHRPTTTTPRVISQTARYRLTRRPHLVMVLLRCRCSVVRP